jgi:hypothetical protein
MSNLIIPQYAYAVRHPVYAAMHVIPVRAQPNSTLAEAMAVQLVRPELMECPYTITAMFKPSPDEEATLIKVLLTSSMKKEYDELLDHSCNRIVLVQHINGHSFAIGNV